MRQTPFRELAGLDMIGWLRNAFQIEWDEIFKAREAFQRQKEHFKEKEVFQGELADMGVIMKAFQTVKESLGRRRHRGCRDVPDKEGIHKRSRGWKDESFNKEVEMMREKEKKTNEYVQGRKEAGSRL